MEVELAPEAPKPYQVTPQGHRIWTDGEIKDIMTRVSLKESYSFISEAHHTTRNAIAGIVKRQREKAGIKAVKRAPPKPKKQSMLAPFRPTTNFTFNPGFALRPKAAPVKRVRLKLIENPTYVTFDELKPHHCRWPFGDPKQSDFRFCGCDRVGTKPYCAAHTHMAGKMYERSTQ